jgi:hypothetical protein
LSALRNNLWLNNNIQEIYHNLIVCYVWCQYHHLSAPTNKNHFPVLPIHSLSDIPELQFYTVLCLNLIFPNKKAPLPLSGHRLF